MPDPVYVRESHTPGAAQNPGGPHVGWASESSPWEDGGDFASARMLGTAMLIAAAGYTALAVGLWRHRRSMRRQRARLPHTRPQG